MGTSSRFPSSVGYEGVALVNECSKLGRYLSAALLLIAAITVQTGAQGASTSQPPALEVERSTAQPAQPAPRVYRTTGSRIAIGRSITIGADEEVTDAVVVIGGSLRVDGRVRDGVVVVGGNVDLGPQADVRGDAVVVGGSLRREQGAQLHGSVSDITFGEWAPWAFGGWWIPMIDFGDFGRWMTLFGAIFRVSMLAVLMILILAVARAPVARIGNAAAAAPVQAFFTGLAAEILFVPALVMGSIALAITIIGIPLVVVLVPLAILLGFVAMVLGFTSIAMRVGEWLEDRAGWRGHSALAAAALGLVIIVGPTLISRFLGIAPWPLRFAGFGLLMTGLTIEFIVWTMGLGATLMTGFGRWSTAPPPMPPPPAVPAVVNA